MDGGRMYDLAEKKAFGFVSTDEAEELAQARRTAKRVLGDPSHVTYFQPPKGTSPMKLMLNNVRLAFAQNLFKPGTVGGEGEPAYSSTFILPPDHPQLKQLRDAQEAVGKEKWGAKWAAVKKELEAKDKFALHDGDTKATYDGFEGNLFVPARSPQNKRPSVFDRDKSPLTEADGRPYSGCYVNASIELWAQDNNYGKRINAQLRGVQFVRGGDSFGGGASAAGADEFAEVEGSESEDLA